MWRCRGERGAPGAEVKLKGNCGRCRSSDVVDPKAVIIGVSARQSGIGKTWWVAKIAEARRDTFEKVVPVYFMSF